MDTEGVSYAVPFDPRRCELPSGRLGIETGPRLAALFRSGVRPLKDDGKLNLRLYRGAALCRRPEIKLLNHVQGLRFESRMSSLRHLYARGHTAGRDCALQPDHPVRIVSSAAGGYFFTRSTSAYPPPIWGGRSTFCPSNTYTRRSTSAPTNGPDDPHPAARKGNRTTVSRRKSRVRFVRIDMVVG